MSATVDALDILLAEREVRALIARAARHSDDGDAVAWAALFTDDGVLDNGRNRVEGRHALHAWAQGNGTGSSYRHFVANVEIVVESADRAYGDMDLLLLGAAERSWTVLGTMRYRDRYRSTAQGWRFASRHIDVVRPPARPS